MKTVLVVLAILLIVGPAWAQEDLGAAEVLEEEVPGQADMILEGGDLRSAPQEPEVKAALWIWGKVESVDFAGSAFVVKHLDYSTADEVVKTVSVDDRTSFHGVMGLADLEAGMHVTIDYKEEDGRCVAEVVNMETGKGRE